MSSDRTVRYLKRCEMKLKSEISRLKNANSVQRKIISNLVTKIANRNVTIRSINNSVQQLIGYISDFQPIYDEIQDILNGIGELFGDQTTNADLNGINQIMNEVRSMLSGGIDQVGIDSLAQINRIRLSLIENNFLERSVNLFRDIVDEFGTTDLFTRFNEWIRNIRFTITNISDRLQLKVNRI